MLTVRCQAQVSNPDGSMVENKDHLVYLGGMLSANGQPGPELDRRLGAARGDFHTLQRVWSHARISTLKKVRIFDACIVSKLLYGLHTSYLGKPARDKLDAFQAKFLRRICGIQHPYYSRVPNHEVLKQAKSIKLSSQLLQRQLLLYGDIARRPESDPLRRQIFEANSTITKIFRGPRPKGRPRHTWANELTKAARAVAGSEISLRNFLKRTAQASAAWRAAVKLHCLRL